MVTSTLLTGPPSRGRKSRLAITLPEGTISSTFSKVVGSEGAAPVGVGRGVGVPAGVGVPTCTVGETEVVEVIGEEAVGVVPADGAVIAGNTVAGPPVGVEAAAWAAGEAAEEHPATSGRSAKSAHTSGTA